MTFDPVWASDENALIDVPSDAEQRTGFVCGPVTPGRFNWLFQIVMSAINSLDIENMVPFSRRIDTGPGLTGGGDLSADMTLNLDIPGLEEEGSIAEDDWIALYDTSRGIHVRMSRSNFVSGLGGGGGGDISGGENIGTGTGLLYASVSGSNLQFRRLLNGGGLTIAVVDDDVVLSLADMGADLTAL